MLPFVHVLGVLLACSVTINVILIFFVNRRKVCKHRKGAISASHHRGHDESAVGQSNNLDDEAEEVNYAALDFSTRNVKRGTKKKTKRELPQECLYSAVEADHHNQQQAS